MADDSRIDVLNRLLARVFRSHVQYAVEAWPWTNGEATPEQQPIAEIAHAQQAGVARLARLIEDRGGVVELGTYPDLSALHYVSLEYLLGKLVADQQALVADLERGQADLGTDAEAVSLVAELAIQERGHLARLQELLAASRNVVHA